MQATSFRRSIAQINPFFAAILAVVALGVLVIALNWSTVTSIASNAYHSALSYVAHAAASQLPNAEKNFSTSVDMSRSLPLAKNSYTSESNPATQSAEAATASLPANVNASSSTSQGLGVIAKYNAAEVAAPATKYAAKEVFQSAFANARANSVASTAAAEAAGGAAPATWTGFSPSTMAELLKANAVAVINHLTPSELHVRFGVAQLGEPSVAVIVFNAPNDAFHGRIVCDDICTNFMIVHADGTQTQLQADKYYGANFDYNTLSPADKAEAESYNINTRDSEMLAQWLFTSYVPYKTGDYLLISGADDPNQGVNNGADAFLSPEHPQDVLFGKDNTANPANK